MRFFSRSHLLVPGLLLCGRSGSGRTSIAKAVMKKLRDDTRIFARKFIQSMLLVLYIHPDFRHTLCGLYETRRGACCCPQVIVPILVGCCEMASAKRNRL